MAAPMPSALVVIHSFGVYTKGQLIVETAAIKAVLDGGMAPFVIPTMLPAVPQHATSGS